MNICRIKDEGKLKAMCDTLVAIGNATDDGSVIFGKNSDRPPKEAQVVRHFPRMGDIPRKAAAGIPSAIASG